MRASQGKRNSVRRQEDLGLLDAHGEAVACPALLQERQGFSHIESQGLDVDIIKLRNELDRHPRVPAGEFREGAV